MISLKRFKRVEYVISRNISIKKKNSERNKSNFESKNYNASNGLSVIRLWKLAFVRIRYIVLNASYVDI